MFDKVKQLNELRKMRSEAMEMQKKMQAITETVEDKEHTIVVKARGDQKIDFISINDEPQPKLVKIINEALDKAQKAAAKKMVEEGGLGSLLKGLQG